MSVKTLVDTKIGRATKMAGKKSNKKWVQKADIKSGTFTAKAKKAGKSVQEYASQVLSNPDRYDTKTVRQANLAKTFKKMSKKKKKS